MVNFTYDEAVTILLLKEEDKENAICLVEQFMGEEEEER